MANATMNRQGLVAKAVKLEARMAKLDAEIFAAYSVGNREAELLASEKCMRVSRQWNKVQDALDAIGN